MSKIERETFLALPSCFVVRLRPSARRAHGCCRKTSATSRRRRWVVVGVVAPRSDGAARTAKYQAALEGGHDVLVLISEVWGGFSPEAMRFLGDLAQARND